MLKLVKTGTLRFADLDFLPSPEPTPDAALELFTARLFEEADDLYHDFIVPLRARR